MKGPADVIVIEKEFIAAATKAAAVAVEGMLSIFKKNNRKPEIDLKPGGSGTAGS